MIRNRIRCNLIPELKDSYNPRIIEALNRLSTIVRTEEIWIDNPEVYRKIRFYIRFLWPDLFSKIRYYKDEIPLFSKYRVEEKMGKFLEEKVYLPSGGYILIEERETLTSIDVNTGKGQRKNLEETIFHTNLEAAYEIPRQIRIRNISGLIIIDFIDMVEEHHRKKVFDTLCKNFKEDKAKTKILSISKLGLVEMSRERTGKSIKKILYEECELCKGSGKIKSMEISAIELKNRLIFNLMQDKNKKFKVILSPELFEFIRGERLIELKKQERERVKFEISERYGKSTFEIF